MGWMAINRFSSLAKMADKAAAEGDLETVATINADKELRSINVQFLVRDGTTWMGALDKLQAGEQPANTVWPGGK